MTGTSASRPAADGAVDAPGVGVSSGALPPDAGKAVAWNGGSRLATRAIQFGVTLVLARLLTPTDFGLAGMAIVITTLVSLATEMGFGTAVIQKADLTRDDVSTAFWTSVSLGVVMFVACAALAPLAALAFHEPRVREILVWSSAGLVIGALPIVPHALLVRRLEFKSVAMGDVASSLAYAVTAIGAALAHLGVWSLVFAGLALAAVRAGVLLKRSRIRPELVVSRESLRSLMPFGMRMFASNLVHYLRSNVDYFLVGATLGPSALGLYTLAFKIADFPRLRLASSVTDVALPAMSRIQGEDEGVARAYGQSLAVVAVITFPLLTGLAALAPEFVRLAYGGQWDASIAPLQILLLMGILLVVADTGITVLVARGRAGTNLGLSLLYLTSVAVLAAFGLRAHIVGVALGVSAATALYLVAVQTALVRVARVRLAVTLKALAVPAAACVAMWLVLLVYRFAATRFGSAEGGVWLLGAVVAGAVAYAGAVVSFSGPATVRMVLGRVRERRVADVARADATGAEG